MFDERKRLGVRWALVRIMMNLRLGLEGFVEDECCGKGVRMTRNPHVLFWGFGAR